MIAARTTLESGVTSTTKAASAATAIPARSRRPAPAAAAMAKASPVMRAQFEPETAVTWLSELVFMAVSSASSTALTSPITRPGRSRPPSPGRFAARERNVWRRPSVQDNQKGAWHAHLRRFGRTDEICGPVTGRCRSDASPDVDRVAESDPVERSGVSVREDDDRNTHLLHSSTLDDSDGGADQPPAGERPRRSAHRARCRVEPHLEGDHLTAPGCLLQRRRTPPGRGDGDH